MATPKIRVGTGVFLDKFSPMGEADIGRGQSVSRDIIIRNDGDGDLIIDGMNTLYGINPLGFSSVDRNGNVYGWNTEVDQTRTWGFTVNKTQDFPITIPPKTSFKFADIIFDGNGLSIPNETNLELNVIFNFYSNDNFGDYPSDPPVYRGNIRFINSQVAFEAKSLAVNWNEKKFVYSKNIHGYLSPAKISNFDLWSRYVNNRIKDNLLNVKRLTIAEFINSPDFINNKQFDDRYPEVKRVLNRFLNPLPPYDFIWPYGDNYAYNGLRRTWDYTEGSRVNQYYLKSPEHFRKYGDSYGKTKSGALNINIPSKNFRESFEKIRLGTPAGLDKNWNIERTLVATENLQRSLNNYTKFSRQRREWGFRERIIKGFPYFFPKYFESSTSYQGVPGRFWESNPTAMECGNGPVIAGIVTAGSGIFSGIESSDNIEYTYSEMQKTVKSPSDVPIKKPKTPSGLIFIQDETGGIGFSLGTDMRYMDHPLFHNSNFAESSLLNDRMHVGSMGIPKADYRQFLREGDFVIIQFGMGLKYWRPILGVEPRYWEALTGPEELKQMQGAGDGGSRKNPTVLPEVYYRYPISKNELTCELANKLFDGANKIYDDNIDINNWKRTLANSTEAFGEPEVIEPDTTNGTTRKTTGRNPIQTSSNKSALWTETWVNTKTKEEITFDYDDAPYRSKGGGTTSTGRNEYGRDANNRKWTHSLFSPIEFRIYFDQFYAPSKKLYPCTSFYRYNERYGKKIKEYQLVGFLTNDGWVWMEYTLKGSTCNCKILNEKPNSKIFVPPYIDNWGAYTNPASNQTYEMSIVLQGFPSTAAEVFDEILWVDQSVANKMEAISSIISAGWEGIKGGAKAGAELGTKVMPGVGTVLGAIAGAVLGFIVAAALTAYLMLNLYYRQRYVLPSRNKKDGQWPFTTFYPIQEEHPWSTGTPIPVNSGMPYIMSDTFMVDTRERIKVPPKVIKNSQLRGIPEDTWKWNPNDEWKIPRDYQSYVSELKEIVSFGTSNENSKDDKMIFDPVLMIYRSENGPLYDIFENLRSILDGKDINSYKTWYINEEINPYYITEKNQFEEFPGIKEEPDTPYTRNPGSQYKGQLIQLKNVRFIEPPLKEYLVPKFASEEKVKAFQQEYESIFSENGRLNSWLEDGNSLGDFQLPVLDMPDRFEAIMPKVFDDIGEFLNTALPVISLIQTFMETFFGEVLKEALGEFGGDILDESLAASARFASYVEIMKSTIRRLSVNGFTGFTSVNQVKEFLAVKHGIDYRGMEVSVDYSREFLSLAHRAAGSISLSGIASSFGIGMISALMRSLGLGFISEMIDTVANVVEMYKVPEVPEDNDHELGYSGRSYVYEVVESTSEFPMSVDKKDGGYWWTCPTIPLTNARSHQNDANYGNPSNDFHEGSVYSEIGIGDHEDSFLTNRTVFSQLISSNIQYPIHPIWDPVNTSWVFETSDGQLKDMYGGVHQYDMSHIDKRYVSNLGGYFSSSYMPFAEEWKPYKYIDGTQIIKNEFKPITPGTKFAPNRVYYVVDDANVVVPIRINANTEIARFDYEVPTGVVDITGIAWQYSLGKPGLEWERERYVMQVWPRYLSDVGVNPLNEIRSPIVDEGEDGGITREEDTSKPDGGGDIYDRDTPDTGPGIDITEKPSRLPDITFDLGDKIRLSDISDMGCDAIAAFINARNQEIINSNSGEQLLGCDGLQPGQEMYIVLTSEFWYGITRTIYFRKDADGNCTCLIVPKGTNLRGTSTTVGGGIPN